jgi:uncharacterized membrane protein
MRTEPMNSSFFDVFGFQEIVFGKPEWFYFVVLAASVLSAFTIWSYRRSAMPLRWKLLAVGLRTIGIALLLVCLLEPLGSLQRPKSQANVFAVLLDNSQSMGIFMQEASTSMSTKLEQSLADDSAWQRRLADDFRMRRYLFDSAMEPVDTFVGRSVKGNESALYHSLQSLRDRYQGQPLAGVLLFTDGNATDRKPESLSSLGFPIYPVRIDASINQRDVSILSTSTRQSDFETSPVTIQASVTHTGFQGESVAVDLLDSGSKVLLSQTLKLKNAGEPVPVEFRFKPEKSGVQGFQVVVRRETAATNEDGTHGPSLEVTLGNNRRFEVVDRGRGPYRILYLAGRPNWEFKFLKRALDADDEIRLTSLIRIARKEPKFSFRDSKVDTSNPLFSGFEDILDEEKAKFDEPVFARLGVTEANQLQKGFPKDAEELFEYNAVIIDDLEHDFLTQDQQSMLRQFVTIRGGGLLVLGGQESMRGKGFSDSVLSQMLPIYCDDGLPSSNADAVLGESESIVRYQLSREGWLQPFLRLADNESAEKERLERMPSFQVLNRLNKVKPGASVLAEVSIDADEQVPVLISQRFGNGRTSTFMIGDLWRWAMRHEGTSPSPLFQAWRQMIRWMIADVPKPIQMQLGESRGSSKVANLIVQVKGTDFRAVDNAVVKLSITSPSGKTIVADAEPSAKVAGQYEGIYVTEEEGVYSAIAEVTAPDGSRLGASQLGWIYQPSASEFQALGENKNSLKTIAEETGGAIVNWSDLDSFVSNVPSTRVPVTETKIYPLWHQSWVLLSALGCICIEWGLRRRYGMA